MGPVQVLVLGLDAPTFSGEVLAELSRLREAGIVRLVDVLLVSRNAEGSFETVAPAGMPVGLGEVTAALLSGGDEKHRPEQPGSEEVATAGVGLASQPVWSLADSVPLGSTAAVALIEHIWATALREAVQRAGGVPLDETWLSPADHELLEELVAQRQQ